MDSSATLLGIIEANKAILLDRIAGVLHQSGRSTFTVLDADGLSLLAWSHLDPIEQSLRFDDDYLFNFFLEYSSQRNAEAGLPIDDSLFTISSLREALWEIIGEQCPQDEVYGVLRRLDSILGKAKDGIAASYVEQRDALLGELRLSNTRLMEMAKHKLDFLAKVSHEVRTPLNSIIGFAELMLHERFGPIGNARYKGYAEDIHQSGLYALSLLNDLLDISKIEAGKFELDFTSVDVAEVVEACVASLQPLAKRTRIVLRTSFADDLPVVVADPRRLRQIMLNLLTNAIKFTPEGGQVILSGTIVGGDLRLRVHDTGVGMSESDIAYAMQPFHQLDTSPRHQSGTGLGLPLTKALTDAIRARLDLTSEPGVGTSADVIFPKERLFRS